MVLWSTEKDFALLLAIIESSEAKITPQWPQISAKLGGDFSAEACRQHFMKIKRQSAGNAAESAHNSPTKSSNANVTTPGKARKSPSKATTTTSARKLQDNTSTRKRKNDAVDLEDDDLGSPSGNHAKKMKAELEVDGAPGDQSLLFKVEDGKTVDLEHDEFVPLPPLYPFPRLKVHSHYN
ncbi:MAG: hypothetical protein M1824_005383 [Vezdaea acicularis]|nr:MAG: hypothetical protein M1824_005383 [Vezdaea acicularis]